jgi:hypothetical protein
MSMDIDWTAKLRAKHARVLTQEPSPVKPADVNAGWRARVEAHRHALLECTHEGSRTRNDLGYAWCSRCGKPLP